MALESRAGAARRRTNAPAGPRARLQRQRFPQVSSARRRASFLAVGFRVETFGKAELETSCPSVFPSPQTGFAASRPPSSIPDSFAGFHILASAFPEPYEVLPAPSECMREP